MGSCTTQKCDGVYILTISNGRENRLSPTLIDAIRGEVEKVKSSPTGSRPTALITTAEGPYFSVGYDLSVPHQTVSEKLRRLVADLISLPMPTIAAVNGRAYRAGLILALSHDYVLMCEDEGEIWLNELQFKKKIPNWYMSILKSRTGDPAVWKNLVLNPMKLDAGLASNVGIVDFTYESVKGTVDAAVHLGKELARWNGEAYVINRRMVFPDLLAALDSDETVESQE